MCLCVTESHCIACGGRSGSSSGGRIKQPCKLCDGVIMAPQPVLMHMTPSLPGGVSKVHRVFSGNLVTEKVKTHLKCINVLFTFLCLCFVLCSISTV